MMRRMPQVWVGEALLAELRNALKSQGLVVTEPGIWKWLNSGSIPDQANIIALSRWLNVKPEWLQYGNSMEPNRPAGTTVAVNTNDKHITDGKIYAISQNGWNRIKRLHQVGPDTVSIRSYNNAEHPPEENPSYEVEIIGRVFWWSVIDY